jgi:hypothetical protein
MLRAPGAGPPAMSRRPAEGGPAVAGPRTRGRRDGARSFVTGDAIAWPQPGRTAASYNPVSREQREFTVTCPSFRIVRYAGQAFITDHLELDPGSPEAIRSHFAKPRNRPLAQFALGIFGCCPPYDGAPAAGTGCAGTRAMASGGRLG